MHLKSHIYGIHVTLLMVYGTAAMHNFVEVTAYKWRNNHVEILKMSVFRIPEHRRKDINQQLEILCALSKVLC